MAVAHTQAARIELNWRGVAAAIGMTLCVVLCLIGLLNLLVHAWPSPGHLRDFCQEWVSAKNYFDGRPVYLSLNESLPLYFDGVYELPIEYNAHPPVSVLAALPLAAFDYRTAFVLWNLTSIAALAVSMWLIMRRDGLGFGRVWIFPIVTLLLTSGALTHHLFQGQLNLLLLLLITGCWAADRGGREVLGGALLGAAMALKLFPGFLLLYFVVRRQWRSAASAAAVFVLLNAAALVVFGADSFRTYFVEVVPQLGQFRDTWPNASVMGFWSKLFDGGRSGHVYPLWKSELLMQAGYLISSGLLVLLAGWKVWQAKSRPQRDVAFGLCIIAMLLVSPVTWNHYFVMLILPLAVLWQAAERSAGKRSFVAAAVLVLLTIQPQWIWNVAIPGREGLYVAQPWQTLTYISIQFYMLLALFVFGVSIAAAAYRTKGTPRQGLNSKAQGKALGRRFQP
jgi:hypothetical protein